MHKGSLALSTTFSGRVCVFFNILLASTHACKGFATHSIEKHSTLFKYIATVRIAEKNIEITCWVSLKMKILQFVSNLKWTYVGQKAGMISWQGRRTWQLVSTCGVEVLMSHGLHGLFDFFAFSEQDDFSAMQISWT